MKTLVTGAGGFLGQYVVEQLVARGDQVRTLQRGDYPALRDLEVEVIRASLTDRAAVITACKDRDVVFHVAGLAGIWGPWDQFYQTNVVGTQNVIAGCLEQRVPKLVFTSSPSVTFNGDDQVSVNETAPYAKRWLCHYAHTKALAEQAVLAANGQQGLATCALRPHLIWGPRDTQLVPRLIARAKTGQLRRVGDGRNLVDVIYVENAAQAHLQAAAELGTGSAVAGKAYFLSQGTPVRCWQWIDQILGLAGLPPVKKSISANAAWRVGTVLEFVHRSLGIQREPRMTRFLAAQLAQCHYYDISAAQRDFAYRPIISIEEGLRRTQDDLRHWANS